MIELRGVAKRFPGASGWAVHDLSLTVREGELLVLLGGSGSGKTTTLKMINRLVQPTRGTILLQGEDTAGMDPVQLRRRIGYAFQGIGLFPHMTVAGNIGIVPRLLGWDSRDIDQRVDELLERVGLRPAAEFRNREPASLSGGQQQRVGVARALAARSRVMLLDEPFGALDPLTRDRLQQEYLDLHRSLELTAVLVTHDMTEALLMADRIAVMQEGKLVRLGTPRELLRDPGDEYTAALMETPRRQADALEALAAGEDEA